MSAMLHRLRKAALLAGGAAVADAELLHRFVSSRDRAALELLVRRHGPMVWGVCRRVLAGHQDAEDAFQATFLVLLRRAGSIRSCEQLANWLHGVARQTALKARATAARRGARERQVAVMPEPQGGRQGPWDDLLPVLDEELGRLPQKYRAAVVLCDLEGKTRQEAARQLGCPEGTVASRLARARTMLAKRLAQRGVVLSGGALAAVLSQNVAPAGVPPSVVFSMIKAASLFAAGQAAAGVISVKVAALTEGVLKAMFMSKLNGATTILLVLSLPLLGVGLWTTHSAVAQQATPPSQAKVKELSQPLVPPAAPTDGKADEGIRPLLPPAEKVDQGGKLTDMAAFYERTGHPEAAAFDRQLAAQKDEPKKGGKKRASADPGKPKADTEKLQGFWEVIETRSDGEARPVPESVDGRLVVEGDEFRLAFWSKPTTFEGGVTGGSLLLATFRLNTTKSPRKIDLITSKNPEAHELCLGIYKLDGDELMICLPHEKPGERRPTEFTAEKGSGQVIYKLKRAKPEKK